MAISFATATDSDATALAALHTDVAEHLARQYGHRSSATTERSVLNDLRKPKFSRIIIARDGSSIVGTFRLATKKPWAIDTAYFTAAQRPLYLTSMAVHPSLQSKGLGRRLLKQAETVARSWPSDAIRLDAYDSEAGAGAFYAKCGFREVGRVIYRKTPLVYFERML